MAALGRELPTAYITGALLIIVSLAFIYINACAIRRIRSKKENLRLSAYGFMVVLAVSNIVQLGSHVISGFFLLTQSDWSLNFVKVVAGNIDAAFNVYCTFVVLLAVNRLVAVVCPVRYHSMFGHSSLRFWYALAVLIWAVDLAFFASPVRTLIWDWETCSWLYLESRAMRIFNECISLGGYSTATAIYALIFVILVVRRKQQGTKLTSSEKNVLLQATFVAVFEWAQTLAWFLPFLPKGKLATLVFNFVWISNCVVSPIAYFVLQKRTAVNCVSSTGVTVTRTHRTHPQLGRTNAQVDSVAAQS